MTNNPLRVCIVDDDDAVRDSLRILLDSYGIDTQVFRTPALFLDEADSIDADCFIFDLHMPDMTGLELVEILRVRHMATPIIILTGRSDRGLAPRMERAGVAAVLGKPVNDMALVSAIEKARSARARGPGCRD